MYFVKNMQKPFILILKDIFTTLQQLFILYFTGAVLQVTGANLLVTTKCRYSVVTTTLIVYY